ncbi:MAG: class I SAM-dependent methyltransferase [Acidimicrobiales bacterium]
MGSRAASLLESARATVGFMPDDEGLALAAVTETTVTSGALPHLVVEIGAYCGRSTLYLAAGLAAGLASSGDSSGSAALFSVDHHHGSEENQAGWEHHDPSLVDPRTGRMDTLPRWRAAIDDAGGGDLVIGIVGDSPTVAAHWASPIGLLFIDGGHGSEPAWADYRGWVPHVVEGAYLAIHDVFPNPADGGRPPYELYCRALQSGAFAEEPELGRGSLRVLRRTGEGQ